MGGGGIFVVAAQLSSVASYVRGGANALQITASQSGGYEGFAADGTGSLGTVTVSYTP